MKCAAAIGIAAVSLCLSARASAQDVPAADDPAAKMDVGDLVRAIRGKDAKPPRAADDTTSMFVIAPVIGSSPSTGFTFGAAGQIASYRGPVATTSISTAVASLTVSTKEQLLFNVRSGLFTSGNRWFVEGDNRLQKTSQDTFGLGGAPDPAGVGANYNFVRLHDTVYHQIARGVFAGAGLMFDSHTSVEPGDGAGDAWTQSPYVSYTTTHGFPADGQQSGGFSLNALVDTRDSQINANRGWYLNGSYKALFDGFLGGDSSWQAVHLDARVYLPLTRDRKHILALWGYSDLVTAGVAPYFDLPTTVMDTYGRSSRGYREGRFRGNRLAYGEVEYRGPLMSNGLLGMVVFANTTTVADTLSGQHLFDDFAPAAGAGLRLLMNKHSKANLCVDLAWGRSGSHGLYLAIQEAF